MDNNPVFLFDPNGDSTFVSANQNGTYTVKDGTFNDNDNGIYLLNPDNTPGDLIGYSATPESFYNSDVKKWQGVIDPNDQSGRNFLNNEILAGDPSLPYYMANATAGKKYDFKRTNNTDKILYTEARDGGADFYRGMPIMGVKNGKQIFGSARDVGNIAAGMVAGRGGFGWSTSRFFGLDFLETTQKHGTLKTFLLYPFFGVYEVEGSSTQYGQRLGYRIGSELRQAQQNDELRRLPGYGDLPRIKVNNDVILRRDYTPWTK
jgi:hypothetical protein